MHRALICEIKYKNYLSSLSEIRYYFSLFLFGWRLMSVVWRPFPIIRELVVDLPPSNIIMKILPSADLLFYSFQSLQNQYLYLCL